MTRKTEPTPRQSIRCAVYTRKSTEEGLDQEFNSLDAQRESGEAYVASQLHEGWVCLSERYDDGGFTGGNMDRPALRRLLADIEAGKIDCVVVYKVDRLSRSLLDFARLMEIFERHRVSFVSVTQQFSTTSSMGRLMLNVLLSFAQFERELISERTRDKMGAARRRGQWLGGTPVLGYDVQGTKLMVNEPEAERVRQIFVLYLKFKGLIPLVQELERRGWFNKRLTTRDGRTRGGKLFTKTSLHRLLTNVTYVGKTLYKGTIYEGQHAAIIDKNLWEQAQELLTRNGSTGGAQVRNRFGALLKGIIRCAPCGCAMSPTHATKGNKRYRYYLCSNAQKRGWETCPSKSIPAHEIEQLVVNQIRSIGQDPALVAQTLAQARAQSQAQTVELETEQRHLVRDLATWHSQIQKLAGQISAGGGTPATARLADLQERIRGAERRAVEIGDEVGALRGQCLDEHEATKALANFDPVWEALTPHEQARLIGLLVERVDYDGSTGKVSITFHPVGIKSLAVEAASMNTESVA